MGALSREKGKEYERLVAAKLRAVGLDVRRGQQADGPIVPDLVVEGWPGREPWIECGHGRDSKTSGPVKLAQAEGDAPAGRMPIAVTREHCGRRDQTTMRLADLVELLGDKGRDLVVACDFDQLLAQLLPVSASASTARPATDEEGDPCGAAHGEP